MRVAKWLGIVALGIVLLALLGAWSLAHFVDPETFKPQLAAAVRDMTGYELRLRGSLKLAWFPWLALQADNGELAGAVNGAASGDGSEPGAAPLLSWQSLKIGVRTLPLLRGELQLDRVQIDGLKLRLQRDAAGVGNWQPLLDRLTASGGAGGYRLQRIAGVTLRDGVIEYRGSDGAPLKLTQLHLDTDAIGSGKSVRVRTAFSLSAPAPAPAPAPASGVAEAPAIPDNTAVQVDAVLSLQDNLLTVRDLTLAARWQSKAQLAFNAPLLTADLGSQRWQLPAANLTSGPATLQLTDALVRAEATGVVARGHVALAPTSLRAALEGVGISVPVTRDPRALQRVAADATFDYSPQALRIQFASLQLDDTHFSGSLITLTPAKSTEFALAGDHLDLDRYRAPVDAVGEPFTFPTAQLAQLRARGVLTLQQAQTSGADLRGVTLRLLFADGQLQDAASKTPLTGAP